MWEEFDQYEAERGPDLIDRALYYLISGTIFVALAGLTLVLIPVYIPVRLFWMAKNKLRGSNGDE